MTVQEMFEIEKIDLDFVKEKMCGDSSYWDSSAKFLKENWDRNIESMSAKQVNWANKILDDCVEKRIKGT